MRPRARRLLEGRTLVEGVALHGRHEVAHEVVPAGELDVDVRPRAPGPVLQAHEPVEDQGGPEEDPRGDEDEDRFQSLLLPAQS